MVVRADSAARKRARPSAGQAPANGPSGSGPAGVVGGHVNGNGDGPGDAPAGLLRSAAPKVMVAARRAMANAALGKPAKGLLTRCTWNPPQLRD